MADSLLGLFLPYAAARPGRRVGQEGFALRVDHPKLDACEPGQPVPARQLDQPDRLAGQLRGPGPLTAFAPTDAAFDAAPASLRQDLLAQGTGGGGGTLSGASPDLVRLRAVLEYHAVRGLYRAADLRPDMTLTTINGDTVRVAAAGNGGLALVNPAPATQSMGFGAGGLNVMPPAPVIQPDVIATNGIIHVIGGVLLP